MMLGVILSVIMLLLSICGFAIVYLRTNDTNKRLRDMKKLSINDDVGGNSSSSSAEILKKLEILLNRSSSNSNGNDSTTPRIDSKALEDKVNELTQKLGDIETKDQNLLKKLDEIAVNNDNIINSNRTISKDVLAMKTQMDNYVSHNKKLISMS